MAAAAQLAAQAGVRSMVASNNRRVPALAHAANSGRRSSPRLLALTCRTSRSGPRRSGAWRVQGRHAPLLKADHRPDAGLCGELRGGGHASASSAVLARGFSTARVWPAVRAATAMSAWESPGCRCRRRPRRRVVPPPASRPPSHPTPAARRPAPRPSVTAAGRPSCRRRRAGRTLWGRCARPGSATAPMNEWPIIATPRRGRPGTGSGEGRGTGSPYR